MGDNSHILRGMSAAALLSVQFSVFYTFNTMSTACQWIISEWMLLGWILHFHWFAFICLYLCFIFFFGFCHLTTLSIIMASFSNQNSYVFTLCQRQVSQIRSLFLRLEMKLEALFMFLCLFLQIHKSFLQVISQKWDKREKTSGMVLQFDHDGLE